MEDVHKGQHIIILKGPYRAQGARDNWGELSETMVRATELEGFVFKILSVDLPFLAVEPISNNAHGKVLDLRRGAHFKVVSEEFARAVSMSAPAKPVCEDCGEEH